MHWDKIATQRLRELGLSHEHARIAVGEIAEHRQQAYMQGYGKGYNDAKASFETRKVENAGSQDSD